MKRAFAALVVLLMLLGASAWAQEKGTAVCFSHLGAEDHPVFPLIIANSKEAAEACNKLVDRGHSFGTMIHVLPADQFDLIFASADDFLSANLVTDDKRNHNGFEVFVVDKNQRGFLPYKKIVKLIDTLLRVTKDKDLRSDLTELRAEAQDRLE